jgi:hypothetical protein
MKEKLYLLAALIGILFSTRVQAQTFAFTSGGTPTDYTVVTSSGTFMANTTTGSVPISPSTQPAFSITVYRQAGAVDNGYVTLVSATSTPTSAGNFNTLISATTSQSNSSSQNTRSFPSWNRTGSSDYLTLRGSFSTSSIPPSDTKLYAVFYAENPSGGYRMDAVSSPIAIVPGNTSTPSTPSAPTTPSPIPPQDLCVPYATRPPKLDSRSTYYLTLRNRRRILWQASKDGTNWEDVYTDESDSYYIPDPVYVNTQFRAIFQKGVGFFWWEDDEGYQNLYFNVSIKGTPPIITQSSYSSCGGPFTVSVQSATKDISFNWYSVDPSWDINGAGRSTTTAGNQVRITPPAGVRPGHYTLNISTNGSCGPKSADSYIDIEVNYNGVAASTDAYFTPRTNDPCYPIFDVISTPVSGATNYQAYLSNNPSQVLNGSFDPNTGYIIFRFGVYGPQAGITAIVTAASPCGPAIPFTSRPQNLPGSTCNPGGGGGGGGYDEPYIVGTPPKSPTQEAVAVTTGQSKGTAANEEMAIISTPYPNPAVQEVTIQANGQNGRALFYDAKGILCKEVKLRAKGERTVINLKELSSGLYHVNVTADGVAGQSTQLVIQH